MCLYTETDTRMSDVNDKLNVCAVYVEIVGIIMSMSIGKSVSLDVS